MTFKDKTVIVTGGNRGIGFAIAKSFAKEGANLVINYVGDENAAIAAKKELEAFGSKCIVLEANVAKFDDCERVVSTAIEAFGSIDILINNAGITKDTLMMRMKEEDFDAVIDVNLKGAWNMMKNVTKPMMKQKSGRIINISSVVALMGNPGQANYVASKSGVIGLTKTLAKEFGPRGITVNAVAPGFIKTAMTDKLSDEIKALYETQIPLGRFGEVEDVANAVLFLASENASYITGQVISVNGGMI